MRNDERARPIFATKLTDANASIAALSETERSLAGLLGGALHQIADEAIQRFGDALRVRIMAENSAMRRAYVRLPVSNVTVSDNEIVIAGSKSALEKAAGKGDPAARKEVPSFDRKWCLKEDKAGHSESLENLNLSCRPSLVMCTRLGRRSRRSSRFGTYVANSGNYDATYGSLGAVVTLLT